MQSAHFRSLATLLLGTAVLVAAQGMLLALVPLRLNAINESATSAAIVGAAYFAGFFIGAWGGDHLIRTVGHIRAYSGLIALVIAATLALWVMPSVAAWAGLRLIHGAAAGGAFLAIEGWLNSASTDAWRGRVLAAYMIITLGALGGAQMFIGFFEVSTAMPFVMAGILYAMSIVPIALTRIDAPEREQIEQMSLKALYNASPFSLVSSFAAGLVVGAFWTIAPYFAADIGLSVEQIGQLMATAIFCGLFLQWPAGYLSDRYDRRRIVLAMAALGGGASLLALVIFQWNIAVLYGCFAALGISFCLYPLSVAHAIDFITNKQETLQLSRGLLMANGLGLAAGPFLAGFATDAMGPHGFPAFMLAGFAAIAGITAYRMKARGTPEDMRHASYVFLRPVTPAGTAIDPRMDVAGTDGSGSSPGTA